MDRPICISRYQFQVRLDIREEDRYSGDPRKRYVEEAISNLTWRLSQLFNHGKSAFEELDQRNPASLRLRVPTDSLLSADYEAHSAYGFNNWLGSQESPDSIREDGKKNAKPRWAVVKKSIKYLDTSLELPSGEAVDTEILPLAVVEKRLAIQALSKTGRNVKKAADLLGIGKSTLYRMLNDYSAVAGPEGVEFREGIKPYKPHTARQREEFYALVRQTFQGLGGEARITDVQRALMNSGKIHCTSSSLQAKLYDAVNGEGFEKVRRGVYRLRLSTND